MGPRLDPWRTPQTSSGGSDKVESISTINVLLVRYDLNKAIGDGQKFRNVIFPTRIS